ncbi:MAG: DoxX family membrane protein [archaeon]|nr:DoxX family membrane protein [archaeon]
MNLEKLKRYSPLVLRLAIVLIFLWFSITQLTNPEGWTRMIPGYASVTASPLTLVYINAIFELILALLLLFGFKTRIVSALLTLHLLHIVTILGYGAVGARDFALAVATLSIFFYGPDEFTIDHLMKKRNKKI